MPFKTVALLRGIAGGLAAGVVGYFLFQWILRQGFYAMILPGAAVGLGFGAATRDRSPVYGTVSAVIGLAVSLFAEWRFFPFVKDPGFGYFITHVHDLKPITLLMIAAGTIGAFWFGFGRERFVTQQSGNARTDTPTE